MGGGPLGGPCLGRRGDIPQALVRSVGEISSVAPGHSSSAAVVGAAPATRQPAARASIHRPVRYSRVGWVYDAGLTRFENASTRRERQRASRTAAWLVAGSDAAGGRPAKTTPWEAASAAVTSSSSQAAGWRPRRRGSTGREVGASGNASVSAPQGSTVTGRPVAPCHSSTRSGSVMNRWSRWGRCRAIPAIRSVQKESITQAAVDSYPGHHSCGRAVRASAAGLPAITSSRRPRRRGPRGNSNEARCPMEARPVSSTSRRRPPRILAVSAASCPTGPHPLPPGRM